MSERSYIEANIEQFMGFAELYDTYRPAIPEIVVDILTQVARTSHLRCVVDLGSGTGLSTRIWAGHADEVIGVEPGIHMRHVAEARSVDLPNIRYQEGLSNATGLPDACADIVTAVQALHWMEPVTTLAEVARLLRPGGIFAAIDSDWPPTFDWEAESLDQALMNRARSLSPEDVRVHDVKKWRKDQHMERMQLSNHFRYTKEIAVHHIEQGSAERMVGVAMSQPSLQTLLRHGITEAQLGIPEFEMEAKRILGSDSQPWYFCYRLRIGVK